MSKISWTEKNVKISDLIEFDINPRKISKKSFDKLVESLKQDGYHSRIKANHENRVIGGHQRIKALLEAGYTKDDEIQILVPNKKLSDKEFRRINIRDNLEFGEWDYEILQNEFDSLELSDFGLDIPDFNVDVGCQQEDAEENQKKEKRCPSCGEVLL